MMPRKIPKEGAPIEDSKRRPNDNTLILNIICDFGLIKNCGLDWYYAINFLTCPKVVESISVTDSRNYMLPRLCAAIIVICAFGTTTVAASGHPKKPGTFKQCAQLVKECFAQNGIERSNCWYASAHHPFCDGSKLGALIDKRWALDSSSIDEGHDSPSLLGPQFVDQACVANCDNVFLGTLINGDESAAHIRQIDSCFDSCRHNSNFEILRP